MAWSGRGRGRRRNNEDPDVRISKTMSFVLRHGAEKVGLQMDEGGFVPLQALLELDQFKGSTEADIRRVVENNEKKRFHLESKDGVLKIRANQGHSLKVAELELEPIQNAEDFPIVVHGTFMKHWESIHTSGLSRMNRTHIHFAPGEPGESGVISGMRGKCDVLIYINMEKALADGLPFFVSANNVILSPGDENGFIKPCYFQKAFRRHPREELSMS